MTSTYDSLEQVKQEMGEIARVISDRAAEAMDNPPVLSWSHDNLEIEVEGENADLLYVDSDGVNYLIGYRLFPTPHYMTARYRKIVYDTLKEYGVI